MTSPRELSFDAYLDAVFASPSWLDACVTMLSAFVEDVDSCRDDPGRRLPELAPPIALQVSALNDRAKRLHLQLRSSAEERGPAFQTSELGAVLWWAGMASHKAAAAAESAQDRMKGEAWEEAFFDLHAMMYETMSALSLLSVAESMMQRMETEPGRARPN
jgi:hypothetical protein